MARTTFELECIVRMEIARTERYQGKESKFARKEYAMKMWVLEMLKEYIHEYRDSDPCTVMENFMKQMEEWSMESTHEEARVAFIMAYDYAGYLYDGLFGEPIC